MTDVKGNSEDVRARRSMSDYGTVLWHAAVFVVMNAILFGIDIAGGGGVQWAYWITMAWGLGLTYHALSFATAAQRMDARAYQRFLDDERRFLETRGTRPGGYGP